MTLTEPPILTDSAPPPRRRARRLVGAVLAILLVAILGYAGICAYMANSVTKPARKPFEKSPEQYSLAYEPVQFPSRVDQIPLDGWLLRPAPGAAARRPVILVHGRGSDRVREAKGYALEIAADLLRDGRPVLLFDLRGSGRSGGERFTLGAQEVRDVGGAIDFLSHRGLAANGITLLGYSMGAATALLVAPGEPAVRAVVEDSGYGELSDVLETEAPKASGLPPIFTPGMLAAARLLFDVDVYQIRPIEAVPPLAARGVPLFVIHGEADETVSVSHGRRIATTYGPRADTLFVPGAEHVASYRTAPQIYLTRLKAFLNQAE